MLLNVRLRLTDLEKAVDRFPVKVTPDTSLTNVLALMSLGSKDNSNLAFPAAPSRSSCVLVMEAEQLVGIFTERDVVRLTVEGIDFAGVAIAEVMTRQVFTLALRNNHNISTALRVMHQHQIRHLPVVDAQGHLHGIVTFASIHRVLQPSNLLRTIRVEDVMTAQVTYACAEISVLEIAQLMSDRKPIVF